MQPPGQKAPVHTPVLPTLPLGRAPAPPVSPMELQLFPTLLQLCPVVLQLCPTALQLCPVVLQLCPTETSPAAKPWMARQGSGARQGHAGEDLQPLHAAKAQGDGLGVAVPCTQTPFPFPPVQLQQLQLRLRR